MLELKGQVDREQQNYAQELARVRDSLARTDEERTTLQKQLNQERVDWDRRLQSLSLQTKQIEDQLETLQRDKDLSQSRFEQQQEAWEGERLELQIHINTLEDSVTLYKARANEGLPENTLVMMEQFKEEAAVELKQRQEAWEQERQSLQEQIQQLRTQQPAPWETDGGASASLVGDWGEEKKKLLEQLQQAQENQHELQEKMIARDRQAEQERSALEAEIEQLMERFLRLHKEQGA